MMKSMYRVAVALAVFGLIFVPSNVLANHGKDLDCTDFANQEEAQKHWDEHGYSADNDPERLDRDGDGIPCEDGEGGSSGSNGDSSNGNGTDKEKKGGPMPETAIDQPGFIFLGGAALLAGLGLLIFRKRSA